MTRCVTGDVLKVAGISSDKIRIRMTQELWCWGQDRELTIETIMSE